MTDREIFSRPIRAAAGLGGVDERSLQHLFFRARVLVRLEEAFVDVPDARETFLLAVNQALRFCPNLAVCISRSASDFVADARALAIAIHGEGHSIEVVDLDTAPRFHAIVNIGREVLAGLPSVTVNSSGWLARMACAGPEVSGYLHWEAAAANPIGSLAAACLGTGRAFLMLIGKQPSAAALELSLFTHQAGMPSSLATGPALPSEPLMLAGLLVGCGAVANGWAYAMRRLPVSGRIEAIDRQSLHLANLGSYVTASRAGLGHPKAELIRDYLSPTIHVTARPEEWELFKIRLGYGLSLPSLVVGGLDNVETRHSVQRLWPETVIDMAAAGLDAQVIVKHRANDGLCLLGALQKPDDEEGYAERLSRETGLRPGRILNEPTTPITEADIEAAPPEKRAAVEEARQRRQLVCGHVTDQNLRMEGQDGDFAPAVPFVTALSGIVGAAETMKWLMGYRYEHALHYQHSAQSGRPRALAMRCDQGCDCRRRVLSATEEERR